MVSRRNFLKIGGGAAALAATGAFLIDDSSDDIELVETKVSLENLPKAFESYRIGFLSDIHLSQALPFEWLERAVKLLEDSKVDLFLLGGDYVWLPEPGHKPVISKIRNESLVMPYGKALHELAFSSVAEGVSKLKAKDGTFAVWGNHDRWTNEKVCQNAFDSKKIKLLNNQTRTLKRGSDKMLLVGFDDYWTGIPKTPTNIREDAFVVCFAHNPDYFSQLLRTGSFKFNLGIAGHTHGGQVRLPLLGPAYHNIEDTRLAEGLFRDESGAVVYTSRGLGMVELPYRINCRPEVTVLQLVKA